MDISSGLRRISGNNVLFSKEEMIPYTRDASEHQGDFPLAVVIPESVQELSQIMKYCYENDVQMTARGGGSSLTGSSVLNGNGVIISLSKFNKILEVKVEDRYALVESGVRLDDLNEFLSKYDHFYPPDPASSRVCTVGGSLSTNAGGLRGAMYGVTKDWVLGIEAVLPNGEIVQMGGMTLKRSAGYDLTALLIGSEGTLGIMTKAILKIWPKPEKVGRVLSYFEDIESAGKAVASIKGKGINPQVAEFMDRISLESIRLTKEIEFPEKTNYMLLLDIASTKESLERQLKEVATMLSEFHPISVKVTTDESEMQKMYEARKGLYSSILSQRKSTSERVVLSDIVVPTSELPATLKEVKESMESFAIRAAIFGHIGDGNIHANIFVDLSSKEKVESVERFQKELGMISLKHAGSVSAEHGIGMEKKDLLKEEFRLKNSPGTMELMKSIKTTIDPKNLLNRGKIFDV